MKVLKNKKILFIIPVIILLLIVFAVSNSGAIYKQKLSTNANLNIENSEYTIVFNGNGNTSGTTASKTCEYTINCQLTPNGFVKTGYTFDGWATSANGEVVYEDEDEVLNLTLSGEYPLYAKWNANELIFNDQTITVEYNGESSQEVEITGASNGTGSYTYTKKSEVNSNSETTNYVSINGTTLTVLPNMPVGVYTVVITVTDNNSGASKDATLTFEVVEKVTTTVTLTEKTGMVYTGEEQVANTATVTPASDGTLTYTYYTNNACTVPYVEQSTKVCRRATSLHTATCNRTDSNGCRGNNKYANGATITYGNLETGETLTPGDAFDCDVNQDGTYDAATERFYYVTSSGDNAVLIYYTNVTGGTTATQNSYAYYASANENWHGPVTASAQLPTTTQWSNNQLIAPGERQILAETGATSTSGGTIESFTYTDKAARLLTAQEVNNACGITVGSYTAGELDGCNYLMENIGLYTRTSGTYGYWLESPRASSSRGVWGVHSGSRRVNDNDTSSTANYGVRPAITVLKSNIDTTTGNNNSIPVLAGSYFVKASVSETKYYKAGESMCVAHTIAKSDTTTTINSISKTHVESADELGAVAKLNSNNNTISNAGFTYTYYGNNSCEGIALSTAPTDPGEYGVIARLVGTDNYNSSDSSCTEYIILPTASNTVLETTTYYKSLQEAIDASETGTATLLVDVSEDIVVSRNANKTINLGNKTLTGKLSNNGQIIMLNGTMTGTNSNVIINEGTMYIRDGLTVTSSVASYPTVYNSSTGDLKVEGGSISSSASNAISNFGTLSVSGGTITITSTSSNEAIKNNDGATLTVTGGTIETTGTGSNNAIWNLSGGEATISGGSLSSSSNNVIINEGTMYIRDGLTVTSSVASYPTVYNSSTGDLKVEGGSISSSASNAIINSGTLSVSGGTITTTSTSSNAAIRNNDGATLTVTGGTIEATGAGLGISNLSGGEATISGGSLSSSNSNVISNSGEMYIRDGLTVTSSVASYPTVYNSSTGDLKVEGGIIESTSTVAIFNGSGATLTVSNGTITSPNNTILNSGTLSVSGGTITTTSITTNAAIKNNDGATLTVTGGTIEGTISGESLSSSSGSILRSASYAISNLGTATISGGTITSKNNTIINSGTLSVSGGTITSTDDLGYAAIHNASGSNLTITGGTIEATGGGMGIWNLSGGEATISGGRLSSSNSNVIRNEGTMYIRDGLTVTSSVASSPTVYNSSTGDLKVEGGSISNSVSNAISNSGTLSVSGGTITSPDNTIDNSGTLSVSGGTITTTSTSDNAPIRNTSILTVTGGTIEATGTGMGIWNLSGGEATISGGSLSSSNSNVIINEGTMYIRDGLTVTSSDASYPTVYNSSTGDLKVEGGSISSSATNTISNSGTLSVSGGTITSPKNTIANSGTLSVSGGTITTTSTSSNGAIRNTSILTVTGGKIEATGTGMGIWNVEGGTVTLSGGTINGKNHNSIRNYGILYIKDGLTLTSSEASYAVNNMSTGELHMDGGSISSTASRALNNAGTAEITGGTLSSDATQVLYNTGTLTIKGGNINSTVTAAAIYNYQGTLTIDGGVVTKTNGGSAAYNSGGTATYISGTCTPRNF